MSSSIIRKLDITQFFEYGVVRNVLSFMENVSVRLQFMTLHTSRFTNKKTVGINHRYGLSDEIYHKEWNHMNKMIISFIVQDRIVVDSTLFLSGQILRIRRN